MEYGERVKRLTYDETLNNVAGIVFPVLQEHKPRALLLPNLTHLTWKAETYPGLARINLFISNTLRGVALELNGTRFDELDSFLSDVIQRTPQLSSFSFVSHVIALPESFIDIMSPIEDSLEALVLSAPGSVSARMGRWMVSLPHLESLNLDLSGRPISAVESFFAAPGTSTPTSSHSRDSGVFSADEGEFEYSGARLRFNRVQKAPLHGLSHLSLGGEVSTITAFLKRINPPLKSLELVVEDPPQNKWAWRKAWPLICNQFGASLSSMRVASSTRGGDISRSTTRTDSPSVGISMTCMTPLPYLQTFEVELPESTLISAGEIQNIAQCCPRVEYLKLCPVSRFPLTSGGPQITLESLLPLIKCCRYLHSLYVVVNAQPGCEYTLNSTKARSESLVRLHVGHSWVRDPLEVTILLSHLAPNLDSVRWCSEKNRPGFVEGHANGWQQVADALPHLRKLRAMERETAKTPVVAPPMMVSRSVDATVVKPVVVDRGIAAMPLLAERSIQCRPLVVSTSVSVSPPRSSAGVQCSPISATRSVQAVPLRAAASVDTTPVQVAPFVDTSVFNEKAPMKSFSRYSPHMWILPFIYQLLAIAKTVLISYPLYIPSRILSLTMTKFNRFKPKVSSSASIPMTPLSLSRQCSTSGLDGWKGETVYVDTDGGPESPSASSTFSADDGIPFVSSSQVRSSH